MLDFPILNVLNLPGGVFFSVRQNCDYRSVEKRNFTDRHVPIIPLKPLLFEAKLAYVLVFVLRP
jgi:hypothetical protein